MHAGRRLGGYHSDIAALEVTGGQQGQQLPPQLLERAR
jgi:hypothetical protein